MEQEIEEMKFDERKKLEDMATELTNIKPIRNKEYTRLTYENHGGHDHTKYKQKRSNIFKSEKRYL